MSLQNKQNQQQHYETEDRPYPVYRAPSQSTSADDTARALPSVSSAEATDLETAASSGYGHGHGHGGHSGYGGYPTYIYKQEEGCDEGLNPFLAGATLLLTIGAAAAIALTINPNLINFNGKRRRRRRSGDDIGVFQNLGASLDGLLGRLKCQCQKNVAAA